MLTAAVVSMGLLAGCSSSTPPPATPGASSTSSTTPAAAAGPHSDSECGLPDVQLSGTVTAAPAAAWELLGSVMVPTSPQAGPGKVDGDGVRHCYARTPTGAVFAAVGFVGAAMTLSVERSAVAKLTVPSAARDAALAGLDAGSDDGKSPYRAVFAGFRLMSYDGSTASVDVAFTLPAMGRSGAQMVNLVWQDGDWRVKLDAGGHMPTPTLLVSTSTYVPFGAGS
jgi:hypothetical protein